MQTERCAETEPETEPIDDEANVDDEQTGGPR